MESAYLKTLMEVARTGNISRAAENLCITQSAASRRIKFLEEQYGYQLLDRSGPVLIPTEAGKIVFEKAQRVIALENDLRNELKKIGEQARISFACTRPFGIACLPAIVKKFMGKYEGKSNLRMSFEMPPNILEGMRENRHDVVVVEHWEQIDFSSFSTAALAEDEMVFISAPQLDLGTPFVEVDQLVGQRLYRRREDCCSGKLLARNMRVIGRDIAEFDKVLIYDDLHVIMDSVLAGEGIAFISRCLVENYLAQGVLLEHRVEGFVHGRSRTLAVNRASLPTKQLRYFVTCILKTLALAPITVDQMLA